MSDAAAKPRRRAPADKLDALGQQLRVMGARRPTPDEFAAIRALMRGHASDGQQKLAMRYVMAELCGVGRVPFAGEATQGTAFRAGSLAVGIAMAQIADVVIMHFPAQAEAERGAG